MTRSQWMLPLLALGLVGAIRGDVSAFDEPKEPVQPLFELRRGWDTPGEGRVKLTVKDKDQIVYVTATAELTDEFLVSVKIEEDAEEGPRVTFTFTDDAAKRLAELTKEHLRKPMVILVKGEAILSATIREPLSKQIQLHGSYVDIDLKAMREIALRVESRQKPAE